MKRFVLALAAVVCSYAQGEVAGDWRGTLQAGGAGLRLVVHIVKSDAGYGGTLDSLDQGAFGLKLARARLDSGRLRFALERPEAEYEGEWNAEAGEFRGFWRQSGNELPLSLKRAAAAERRVFLPGGGGAASSRSSIWLGRRRADCTPKLLVDNTQNGGAYS